MKVLLALLVSFVCFGATEVAKAETITIEDSNFAYLDDAYDTMINFYNNSNYANYVITSERIYTNDYRYYSKYYICLTSEKLEIEDPLNVSSSCDEIFIYNSNDNSVMSSSGYLNADNSVYYSSNYLNVSDQETIYIICFLIVTGVVGLIIFSAIDKVFKPRGGGLKYEEI